MDVVNVAININEEQVIIKTLLPTRSITYPKIGEPTAEIYDGIPKSYAAYTSDNKYFF